MEQVRSEMVRAVDREQAAWADLVLRELVEVVYARNADTAHRTNGVFPVCRKNARNVEQL
jgi:hypothetical protein